MSRSYKKVPYVGDSKGKKKKRCANSKVRMFLKNLNNKIPNSSYKKVFCSYDICDYYYIESWQEYWETCLRYYNEYPERYKHPPNKKEEYRQWYKWYKMK